MSSYYTESKPKPRVVENPCDELNNSKLQTILENWIRHVTFAVPQAVPYDLYDLMVRYASHSMLPLLRNFPFSPPFVQFQFQFQLKQIHVPSNRRLQLPRRHHFRFARP